MNGTLSEVSKFLSKDVIDKVFKVRTNSQDNVQSIEVASAAPAGEGLLSAVFRIRVTGMKYTTSFIVKGFLNDPLLRKAIDSAKYFKRETLFFTSILPVLSDLQISLGAKERIQFNIPVCYSCYQDGHNDYILLEDLSETHCATLSEYPTEEQREGVLKTLAHLHAVSMALRLKRPDIFNKTIGFLSEMYYNEENRNWYSKYLEKAIEIDQKVITEFENSESLYYKKFNKLLMCDDLYGQYIHSVSTRGDHPVLCHGDVWSPNFLHSPNRTVAIDFQLARCASPATDVAYWCLLCCNHRTVKEDFMNAIEVYYSSLQYYLKDMGFHSSKVFSRETLDQELKLNGKYAFFASMTSFPLLAADRNEIFNSKEGKYSSMDKIPLECLWQLTPIKNTEDKLRLINAVRIAVDVGLI